VGLVAEAIGGERIAVEDESCDWRVRVGLMTRPFAADFATRWEERGSFGVERGQNVCFLWPRGGFFLLKEAHDQVGDDAAAFFRRADLGAWGKGA
jgi:hypothetical protein